MTTSATTVSRSTCSIVTTSCSDVNVLREHDGADEEEGRVGQREAVRHAHSEQCDEYGRRHARMIKSEVRNLCH